MKKQFNTIAKCLMVLVLLSFIFSCKKEHLEPATPPGNPAPLVYITSSLDNDSVYFAGGVNNYVGNTSVTDSLTYRAFNFTLKNPNHPAQSYFQISINNYQNALGVAQTDLDSSINVSTRNYQDTIHFMPLAATVEWIDAAGIKFTSVLSQQTHLFSITSVEDVIFENKHYKKATVEFECNLSDSSGHILHLTNGRATLLFGLN